MRLWRQRIESWKFKRKLCSKRRVLIIYDLPRNRQRSMHEPMIGYFGGNHVVNNVVHHARPSRSSGHVMGRI